MDAIADNQALQAWLIDYGSFALFFLLTIGILALPVPEETLMIIAGILMNQGKLHIPQTVIAAVMGSLCGITISYILGRKAGTYLVTHYGGWIGLKKEQLDKAHTWFERFGKWTLFFGYFIPGIRHFTGFTAGMTLLRFQDFALFAYSGALIWVITFLSLGYFFGNYWFDFFKEIEVNIDDILTVLILLGIVYLIYLFKIRNNKN